MTAQASTSGVATLRRLRVCESACFAFVVVLAQHACWQTTGGYSRFTCVPIGYQYLPLSNFESCQPSAVTSVVTRASHVCNTWKAAGGIKVCGGPDRLSSQHHTLAS
ncbi:hypothetical protein B0T19DRAFT_423534 [Cercophora scortea]|uniref:Uncharacterized protein n=1 Tax=Cercophora scortea TaxID=314031 RepID=A0AAE0IN24_9PEZI|nr:hypothetical protein B0T19DRAFT_423534 [Cercophora scortea]